LTHDNEYRASAATPRVAYVILSHRGGPQLARLVGAVLASDPAGHVVVHHDGRHARLDLGASANDPRVRVLESNARRDWGSWPVTADILEAIAIAETDVDPDWIVLLSGQDYPTRSLTGFGAELAVSGYDAFVSARPVPESRPPASDTAGLYAWIRCNFTWRRLPDWVLGWLGDGRARARARSVIRRVSLAQPWIFIWSLPAGGGDLVGIRRRTTPFGPGLRCYMGATWLTLSRVAAAKVLRFVAERPDVVDVYRTSVLADESLILTILLNDPSLRVALENHHHLRMTGPGDARAAVLTVADLPAIERSGRPFTRKVDPTVDSEVPDRLDARIQGGLKSEAG
jgi:Core-2/I-Branching enzyme